MQRVTTTMDGGYVKVTITQEYMKNISMNRITSKNEDNTSEILDTL